MKPLALFAVLVALMVFVAHIARTGGESAGYREASEKYRSELCSCGAKRSCVFGPGIIGVQWCDTGRWSECEPDPKFRVPQKEDK
jgi:hypothetical protein